MFTPHPTFLRVVNTAPQLPVQPSTGEWAPHFIVVLPARRQVTLCPITGKRSYPSEKSAKKTLRQIQIKPGANQKRTPCSTYQCAFCNRWHLTSQDYRRHAG